MKELTSRQQQILNFITVFSSEHGCPPTVRETAEYFSISIKAVQDHFSALRKKEYLAPAQGRSRSLRVLVNKASYDEEKVCAVPVLGDVAAGRPVFCDENHSGSITVPGVMLRSGFDYFAVYVKGDSMSDVGILNGDIALIRKQNSATDNEIVVALIEDSVTLKRFFKEPSRIRLEPENKSYNPIYCQEVRILGILSNIIRNY